MDSVAAQLNGDVYNELVAGFNLVEEDDENGFVLHETFEDREDLEEEDDG